MDLDYVWIMMIKTLKMWGLWLNILWKGWKIKRLLSKYEYKYKIIWDGEPFIIVDRMEGIIEIEEMPNSPITIDTENLMP